MPPSNAPACDRCGCKQFTEHAVHHGKSMRRDCARCGRTLDFVEWYGVSYREGNLSEAKQETAAEAAVKKRRARKVEPKQKSLV